MNSIRKAGTIALLVGAFVLLAVAACVGTDPDVNADGTTDAAASADGSSNDQDGNSGADGAVSDAADGGDAAEGGPAPVPKSCDGVTGAGLSNCGPDGGESCCTTLMVPTGTFGRMDDGGAPATVSAFRLDRFETSVGRFRRFVSAVVVDGWRPPAGSGKHTHLHGGDGLVLADGSYEPGWDSASSASLPATQPTWDTNLACNATYQTWTSTAGNNEKLPINCVTWLEAYAFCTWDGGFLPSGAEWGYAAAGGSEQRLYPWSNPPTTSTIDCTYANYTGGSPCVVAGPNKGGSESPIGDGKWGHADLGGNVWEFALDWFVDPYFVPCNDCAQLAPATDKVSRGGSFNSGPSYEVTSKRFNRTPTVRGADTGFRCARAP